MKIQTITSAFLGSFFAISFVLLGCGGGSTGTGGRELEGFVFRDAVPLTDVEVSTIPPSDTTSTDEAGMFSLEGLDYTDTLEMKFESPSSLVVVDLVNIPATTEKIRMQCNYDELNGKFEVVSADYLSEDGTSTPGTGIVVFSEEKPHDS